MFSGVMRPRGRAGHSAAAASRANGSLPKSRGAEMTAGLATPVASGAADREDPTSPTLSKNRPNTEGYVGQAAIPPWRWPDRNKNKWIARNWMSWDG